MTKKLKKYVDENGDIYYRETDDEDEKWEGYHGQVRASKITALAIVIAAVIGAIGAIPVGSENEKKPLACSFTFTHGIYVCGDNNNLTIGSTVVPQPSPAIATLQTLIPSQTPPFQTSIPPSATPVNNQSAINGSFLTSVFGSGNWFCFPDRFDSVGVRSLPPDFAVKMPIYQIDSPYGTYNLNQTAPGYGPATAWLAGSLLVAECPQNQQTAIAIWHQDSRPITINLINEILGSENWICDSSFPNLIKVTQLVSDLTIGYPLSSVDKNSIKYAVGEIVPKGGAASVWIGSGICPT
jgi:hypothetical protein